MAQAKANRANKGNPASKRMSNKNLQARRERSWLAGKAKRKARDEAQQRRAADNRVRRARGEATPWEIACTHRAAKRHGVEPAT